MEATAITSAALAEEAWLRGDLYKVLLLPEDLGGDERPENVIYILPGAFPLYDRVMDELVAAVERAPTKVSIVPGYRDESFIPESLTIVATRFNSTDEIVRVLKLW